MAIATANFFTAIFGHDKTQEEIARKRRVRAIGDWSKNNFELYDVIDWTGDYIVFIDESLDLDYRKETAPDELGEFNQLLNQCALIETSISPYSPINVRIFSKRLIGEAMACVMEEDFANAKEMLESAATFILARSRETSRIWYISFSAMWAIAALVPSLAAWLLIHHVKFNWFGENFLWMAVCGGAGAVGALLSIISRTGALEFDAVAGPQLHCVESASKIGAGVISGVIAGLAIRSGLALEQLFKGSQGPYFLLLASCSVGAGERFVDSIISNVNSLGLRGRETKLASRTSQFNNPSPEAAKPATPRRRRRR